MSSIANLLSTSDAAYERKLWALMAALLALFLFYPLAIQLDILRFYRLALSVVLVFAAYSVSSNRRVLRVATLLGVPSILGQIAATSFPVGRLSLTIVAGVSLAFILFVSAVIFASTFRSGTITGDRIAGAICVYLLAGLFWAMLYGTVLAYDPTSFELSAGVAEQQLYRIAPDYAFVYFSFVTITTLGYGDVLPISPTAQTLAWLEAVFGQLYIAILVARLVGLHIAQSRQARSPD